MADQPLKKVPGSTGYTSMLGGSAVTSALTAEVELRGAAAAEDLVVAGLSHEG